MMISVIIILSFVSIWEIQISTQKNVVQQCARYQFTSKVYHFFKTNRFKQWQGPCHKGGQYPNTCTIPYHARSRSLNTLTKPQHMYHTMPYHTMLDRAASTHSLYQAISNHTKWYYVKTKPSHQLPYVGRLHVPCSIKEPPLTQPPTVDLAPGESLWWCNDDDGWPKTLHIPPILINVQDIVQSYQKFFAGEVKLVALPDAAKTLLSWKWAHPHPIREFQP